MKLEVIGVARIKAYSKLELTQFARQLHEHAGPTTHEVCRQRRFEQYFMPPSDLCKSNNMILEGIRMEPATDDPQRCG